MLDTCIARLWQISRAIQRRIDKEFKAHAKLVEWQTRTTVQFIAATTGKEGKDLQKQAGKITLTLAGEAAQVDTDDEAPRADDPAVYIEQGSQSATNRPGSLEALAAGIRSK